ncbi:AraC family transcriptional regulator [Neorhizobium sp. P12A]|uniref:AraC family transcriptional regulator n=1 Tax=Neorhizobium sp. P12A TaxID=2268027 RepID=UPI00165E597E|nr:AraC family transcriptional regulator [Neorhizobium sp. P12A]
MITLISAEASPKVFEPMPISCGPGTDPHALQDGTEPRSFVRRWFSTCSDRQHHVLSAGDDETILLVALEAASLRLSIDDNAVIYDGVMMPGMTCICMPNRNVMAEVPGPVDFLQLHIRKSDVRRKLRAASGASVEMIPRDSLVYQLARAILTPPEAIDESSAETLAEAIALRSTQIIRPNKRVAPLAKWRLRQVFDFVASNLARTILIDDMAAAAGLSRSQFAAQFRLSTGCTPHEYILLQRVEAAKQMLLDPSTSLIEVALAVGFQNQAHFSTVFKQFVNETPGRWRKDIALHFR